MPRISIKTLPLKGDQDAPRILQRLGKMLESNLGFLPHQFVMTWEFIWPGHFLYNGRLADIQPSTTHHPFIEITAVKGMPGDRKKTLVRMLAETLSHELEVAPDNICVTMIALDPGDLFVFGDFK